MSGFGQHNVDLTPVLEAIETLKGAIQGLSDRMDRLEKEVNRQGMLMRAMARVILPEEVMATTLSDRDLDDEIVRKDAEELRRKKHEETLDELRKLGGELG